MSTEPRPSSAALAIAAGASFCMKSHSITTGRALPEAALKLAVKQAIPPRDFAGALTRSEYSIIAELKKASPSRGVLRQDYAPSKLAAALEVAGAAALSVLTEEDFFLGSLADLKAAKKAAQIPILRKDFIFDPWQVWEARAAGADAFLLIAAILEDETLRELLELGRSLKMEPLVEVHSREELSRAIAAGASIIGVNNRDLRTFKVRIETSLELIEDVPEHCIAVSESGLPGMTPDAERYFRDLYDHLIRISDLVDSYRDLLSGAMDTHLYTVSNRLNEVMKQLTIIATVFLPLSFLTGFFGQNFSWLVGHIAGRDDFIGYGIGGLVVPLVLLFWWLRLRRVRAGT